MKKTSHHHLQNLRGAGGMAATALMLFAFLTGCQPELPTGPEITQGVPSPSALPSSATPPEVPPLEDARTQRPTVALPSDAFLGLPQSVERTYMTEEGEVRENRTLVTMPDGYALYLPETLEIAESGDFATVYRSGLEIGSVPMAEIQFALASGKPEKVADEWATDNAGRYQVEAPTQIARPDAPVDGWSVYAEDIQMLGRVRWAYFVPADDTHTIVILKSMDADAIEPYNALFDSVLRDFCTAWGLVG